MKGGEPNKVFVGGLPQDCRTEMLSEYFGQFGTLTDSIVMTERETGRSRGFGFVTFELGESVDQVMAMHADHQIQGKWIDCKRASEEGSKGAPGKGGGGKGGKGKDFGGDRKGGGKGKGKDKGGPPAYSGYGAYGGPPAYGAPPAYGHAPPPSYGGGYGSYGPPPAYGGGGAYTSAYGGAPPPAYGGYGKGKGGPKGYAPF